MQKLNKTYVRAEISAEYACHLEKMESVKLKIILSVWRQLHVMLCVILKGVSVHS